MNILTNKRFIGLTILCAIFCFGQESWPPTTTISVEQELYKPAQYVKLIASTGFFHVLTKDDPVGTKTLVSIEGQEIPISVKNEREAAFPLPYLQDITERTTVTGTVDGITFDVQVDPPEPAPNGTDTEISNFLARYQQANQIMVDAISQRAEIELTDPDEKATMLTAADNLTEYYSDLESILQELMSSYPDAAEILASTLYTSGANQSLQDYIDAHGSSLLNTQEADCSVADVLAVVDTILSEGGKLAAEIGFSSWAGGAAMKVFSSAGAPFIEAMATKIGNTAGTFAVGSGLMQLVTPSGGGEENDLTITVYDTTLSIGPPGEEAPLWVQVELETEDDSIGDIFDIIAGRIGSRDYGLSFEVHGFIFEVYIPTMQSLMPTWWNKPFGIRKITVDVPNEEVNWFTLKEFMIDVFPATEPAADCNQMTAKALYQIGDVTATFTWYAFDRLFRAEVDYTIVSGPLAENWSTADGVYPGDYGTIEGDLGTWQYLWRGDQMTTDPCNRRIVVDNGTLTAYECHHEVGGYGFGKVWVWLDNFHGAQAFYPLNHVFWNFSSSGEFGPDGYAYFYVGQLYSDMHAATGGGALSPAGSDFMAIRPPKNVNPEAAGSMYFGAILYSNYHEEDPDFSMAQMTLSGIEIEPYDAEIQVFPPDDYGPFTEDFRGITETYRPLVIEVWPFLTLEGFVNIPGTFGRWGAHFYSTQYNTNPCDTRVEVDNGQVVVHSCHHEYLGGGQGYARFQLESLYMEVPYFDMTNITWDLDHTAPGGSATDVLSIGISGFGRWDSPGGVAPGSLNLDPIRKLILVGDGTMWPDFAFKSRVTWTEAPQEVNEFQINVNEVIITGVPPEGAEGQGEQQLFTYDGYPIPNFSLADHKESEESLK